MQRFWRNPLVQEHAWATLFGVVVGILAALCVAVFKLAFHGLERALHHHLPEYLDITTRWYVLGVLVVGGLVMAAMHRWVLPKERYHGVTSIIRSVVYGGLFVYRTVPWKALAAVVSLGFGASVGPEDPSVQIGAGVGAWLSRRLRVSTQRSRLLVATGAAAGIATAFNAPIAGVFFAIEIVLREFATGSLGVLVLGAVAASVVSRMVFGPYPAFPIPPYALHSPWELPLYLGLGALAALVALVYVRALEWGHKVFHPIPRTWRPILAALGVGLMVTYRPELMGDSYDTVSDILYAQDLIPTFLAAFMGLKILATALSLGGGFLGGVFAPSLALGAALGALYGVWMRTLFPMLNIQPSAFALVGMAAVLAGAVRAPITAIMLLFEMTNDYHIILPLMAAVVLSVFIGEVFEPESVYTLPLAREGLRLGMQRGVDVLERLKVREIMKPAPDILRTTTPLAEAARRMDRVHAHGLPVVDDAGRLYGILSLSDIERAVDRNPENISHPAREFCTRELVVTHPNESVADALRKMVRRDIGRLPVVDPQDPTRLLGWLNRIDVLRAYELALMEHALEEQHAEHVQLEAHGTHVIEATVPPDSPLVGKKVCEIPWPESMLLASVQRGTEHFIPHGDTEIRAYDHLNLVTLPQGIQEARAFVKKYKLIPDVPLEPV